MNCAVVKFDLESGVAASQAFVFDTEVAVLIGESKIDLGTEQVDFLLAPKPKHPRWTSLATEPRVSGTIMDPKVSPEKRSLAIALSALQWARSGFWPRSSPSAHTKSILATYEPSRKSNYRPLRENSHTLLLRLNRRKTTRTSDPGC